MYLRNSKVLFSSIVLILRNEILECSGKYCTCRVLILGCIFYCIQQMCFTARRWTIQRNESPISIVNNRATRSICLFIAFTHYVIIKSMLIIIVQGLQVSLFYNTSLYCLLQIKRVITPIIISSTLNNIA